MNNIKDLGLYIVNAPNFWNWMMFAGMTAGKKTGDITIFRLKKRLLELVGLNLVITTYLLHEWGKTM